MSHPAAFRAQEGQRREAEWRQPGDPTHSIHRFLALHRTVSLDELLKILKSKRELWTELNPGRSFPGVVVLQIDRRVPALVVKRAFQTAAVAGFPAVSFQVARPGVVSGGGDP